MKIINPLPRRILAILIFAALFASIIYGLSVGHPIPELAGDNKSKGEDLQCYRAIVQRVRGGETYYSAAGHELRERGYATASVFNWRLPLLARFLSCFPSLAAAKCIVFVLAIVALVLWLQAFMKSGYAPWQILAGGFALFISMAVGLVSDLCYMHEFWVGTIIIASLALHARSHFLSSAMVGVTALFLRELALPFVLLMLLLAYFEGRKREALVWAAGAAVFCVEFFFHWSTVSKIITEKDLAMPGGWVVFSGWPFVLNTAQMNPFLVLAPPWIVAIVVPFALLGLARFRNPLDLRLAATVILYMLAFAVVGRSFNYYWGLIYSPLLLIGLLHAPKRIKQLWLDIRV